MKDEIKCRVLKPGDEVEFLYGLDLADLIVPTGLVNGRLIPDDLNPLRKRVILIYNSGDSRKNSRFLSMLRVTAVTLDVKHSPKE